MSTTQRIPVIVLIIWFAVITTFMLLNQVLDLEIFFVLALIGLLIVVEMIDTATVQSRSLRRIKYVIVVGVLLFGYTVVNKIMEIVAR
ncbi:hypothetical protein [Methanosphaerula palustris]|uniref:Uncharacterized protein n=1 Tax=Methanosphaerula palustris (strain ATCC BAA-1556 / DSM 19958 / E1-9c) TaxID=521011 RepID=B8GJV5_METPE|nr:hypothetical protein [Methanosphaerula palustris]ACL15759.1 conserved hypothetical protein [Methanosphaerula palustris E1-9c]